MSDQTPNLSLPYILPSQAQKHVTHNEAIERLDHLVQLSVATVGLATPPATPTPNQRFIVAADAVDAWTGQSGSVAIHQGGGWLFERPQVGWVAYVEDEAKLRVWDGSAWTEVAGGAAEPAQRMDQLGVNTDADATNKLSVSSEATLLTHTGAGHQLKVNKASPTDTASLLFQTNWSGRAEMGLTGDDRFAIKVSADGTSFATAAVADPATGRMELPQGAQIDGTVTGSAVHDGGFGAGTGLLQVGSFGVGGGAAQTAQPVSSAVRSGVYAAAGSDTDFAPGGDGVLVAAAGMGRVAQLGINGAGASLRQSTDGGGTWSEWAALAGQNELHETLPDGTRTTFPNGFRISTLRLRFDGINTRQTPSGHRATLTAILRDEFAHPPSLQMTLVDSIGYACYRPPSGPICVVDAIVLDQMFNGSITVEILATGMAKAT